jgi:anti-sigma B factor antagonist
MDRPTADLSWRLEPSGADTVLHLEGELDISTVPRLNLQLDELVRQEGGGAVTLDLGGLEFVDSTGLHVLLNAQRRLTRQGRSLRVIVPPGAVRRAIELSRLTETLGVA